MHQLQKLCTEFIHANIPGLTCKSNLDSKRKKRRFFSASFLPPDHSGCTSYSYD